MTQHAKLFDEDYCQGVGREATAHHRLVLQAMPEFRKKEVSTILDVGCGSGLLLRELSACKFVVTGTEICPSLLEKDLKGEWVYPYSVDDMGVFVDRSFDLVMGVDLLPSLRDKQEIEDFLRHALRISVLGVLVTFTDLWWATVDEPHLGFPGPDVDERRDKQAGVRRWIRWREEV